MYEKERAKTMSKDSSSSYLHLTQSHYVQHSATWVHDKLPDDPIEAPAMVLVLDDDNDSSSIHNSAFGATKGKTHKDPLWKDLQLDKIMRDDPRWWKSVQDDSALKVLDKVDTPTFDELIAGSSDMRHTGASGSSSSTLQLPSETREPITTPEMLRNRGGQRNLQNYQTPIGRILR